MRQRLFPFDLLKTIGMLCIILAHMNPPKIIFQLRNFDVPLLVIISGAVFKYTFSLNRYSYWMYVKKRALRLLGPTWLFLLFFYTFMALIYFLSGKENPYSGELIFNAFMLGSMANYVWIIRVFLLVALVAPLIFRVYDTMNSSPRFLLLVIAVYLGYEVILYAYSFSGHSLLLSIFFEDIIFYLIPYGCLFALGMALSDLEKSAVLMIGLGVLVIGLGQFVYFQLKLGEIVYTQRYKYPPRTYYLMYAVFISLLLYYLADLITLGNGLIKRSIVFISSSSLWIYLWHILFIEFWNQLAKRLGAVWFRFLLGFFIVTTLAVITTILQKKFAGWLIRKSNLSAKTRDVLEILLLK